MAENGIYSTNLPLDDFNPATEVLVHSTIGGELSIRRQSLGIFIARILSLATEGGGASAPAVLATLLARGFTLDADGNLHLTEAEADIAAAIITATHADGLRRQKRAISRIVTGTARRQLVGDTYGPANFVRWEVGDNPPRPVENPRGVVFWLGSLSQLFSLSLAVYQRSASLGNGGANGAYVSPGEHPQDLLVSVTETQVRDLSSTPFADAPTPVMLPFNPDSPFVMTTDNIYFYVLQAKSYANQAAPIQLQRGRDIVNRTVDPIWRQGAFRGPSGGSIAPSDNGMVAHALVEAQYVEGFATGADARSLISAGPRQASLRQFNPISDATFSVELPELSFTNQPNPIAISGPGTVVAIDRLPFLSLDKTVTLSQGASTALGVQYIDGVTVTSSGATWAEGVDYRLNRTQGSITMLRSGTASMRVVGNYVQHRYDMIVADRTTGILLVAKGTPRDTDPNGYAATATNFVPLYRAYVTRDGVELLPVHEWVGLVRRGREAEHTAHLTRNRARLAKALGLLAAGAPIRLGLYGDSITAVGGGSDYYSPNGPTRDQLSFYNDLPADTRAKIERFDGPAGPGTQIRVGYGWVLKAVLEKRYGSLIEIRNWGVAGSDTSADLIGGSIPGGTYPQRLNAYLADQCHLTLLAFGMNQFARATTYQETVAIIQAIQAQGGEVIVITPPRPNTAEGFVIDDWQGITHRDLIKAAEDTGSAYVDFSAISGPGNEAGIGFVSRTLCEQNRSNHPGPTEYGIYGRYVAETFTRF